MERKVRTTNSYGRSAFVIVRSVRTSVQRLTYPLKDPSHQTANIHSSVLSSSSAYTTSSYRNVVKTSTSNRPVIQINASSNTSPTRFIVRDFVYSEEQIAKQEEDLEIADTTEKELWVRPINAQHSPFPSTPFTDRAPEIISDQFLRVLPDPRTPEDPSAIC